MLTLLADEDGTFSTGYAVPDSVAVVLFKEIVAGRKVKTASVL